MNILSIATWMGIIFGSFLALMFLVLTVHVRLGNKNFWLTVVVIMLLFSNIGILVTSLIDYQMWTKFNLTETALFIQGCFWAVADGFFSVAHFLLAMKYQEIVRRIPMKLEGKPARELTSWDTFLYWFLFAMNIIFPICESVSIIPFNKTFIIND